MINQDIVRTYPEITFFQSAEIRAMMLRVLFVYSKMHPVVSYKQGMHELLAPFIYLLERNKQTCA
jgi:TBC1 domain family protein 5